MASKIRSKIPEPGYSILQKKREYLCSELHARHVVDGLFSSQIFDEDDKDRIEKAENTSNRDGVRKMLDILCNSGPNAYEKFLEVLDGNGYEIVAIELKATVVEIPPDPFAWIDELPDRKRNHPLNEKTLLRLSNYFAGAWEGVMVNLGNTEGHIYQDKANNQLSPLMQIFHSLNRWRQRQADDATVIVLLRAMKDSGSQIDWNSVKKFVMELQIE